MSNKFEMFRGDNKTMRVTIVDGDGDSVGDTSGWRIRMSVKLKDTDAATVIFKDSDVAGEATHVSANIWDIFILRADTTALAAPLKYVYDVEAETDAAPAKFHTVVKDEFKLLLGVTTP